LNFFQFFWTIIIYQNHFFNFLRTMILNLKIAMGHLFTFCNAHPIWVDTWGLFSIAHLLHIYPQRINCKCGLCVTSLMHLPLQCEYSKSLGVSTSGACSYLVNILLEAISSSFLDGSWHFEAWHYTSKEFPYHLFFIIFFCLHFHSLIHSQICFLV